MDLTCDDILALRRRGAVYVEVSSDGALTVEFEGVPAKRTRTKPLAPLENDPKQIDMFASSRVKELSDEDKDRLMEQLQQEYVP